MTNKHVNDSGCEEFCDYEETREIFETNAARRNFFWTSYQNGPPKTTTPSPTTLPLANRSDDSSYSSGKSQNIPFISEFSNFFGTYFDISNRSRISDLGNRAYNCTITRSFYCNNFHSYPASQKEKIFERFESSTRRKCKQSYNTDQKYKFVPCLPSKRR